jgi:hypothetical protein
VGRRIDELFHEINKTKLKLATQLASMNSDINEKLMTSTINVTQRMNKSDILVIYVKESCKFFQKKNRYG